MSSKREREKEREITRCKTFDSTIFSIQHSPSFPRLPSLHIICLHIVSEKNNNKSAEFEGEKTKLIVKLISTLFTLQSSSVLGILTYSPQNYWIC